MNAEARDAATDSAYAKSPVTCSHTTRAPRAPHRSRFRRTRMAAAVAGLAGALVLTACSGDGSDGSDDPAAPSPPVTTTADFGPGTGGSRTSPDTASALEGSWLHTTEGGAVALVITGEDAALFAAGGSVCRGSAKKEAGTRSISLTCDGGSKERARGTVEAIDNSSLKVTWEGTPGTETYTKAVDGKLPTGFPTSVPNS